MSHTTRGLVFASIGVAIASALGACSTSGNAPDISEGTSAPSSNAQNSPTQQSGPPPISPLVSTTLDSSNWTLATFPDGDATRHLVSYNYSSTSSDGSSSEGNASAAINVPALQSDARFAWHISDGKALSTALLTMPKDFPFSSNLTVDLKTKAFSTNDTGWIAVVGKKDIPKTFSVTTADGTAHSFEMPPKAHPEIEGQVVIVSTYPADNPPTYGNPGE